MENPEPRFGLNRQVQIVGNPDRIGVVTHARSLGDTHIYTVFFNATDIKEVRERDLVEPGHRPGSIIEKIVAEEVSSSKQFKSLLTLKKIQVPLTSNVYSFLASRTQLYLQQFKPLLKFLNSNYHRILIADEVGVGKTIEAGIIYTEMKARLRNLERVLIICPSYLLQRKWQDEMYSRFDEDFEILDGAEFKNKLRDWSDQSRFRGIISLPLLRRREYLDLLVEMKPDFDLIIVDEAHHFRNDDTNTFDLGELLSSLTNVMVFLTATPIHISNRNLFNLLYLLVPQEFPNEEVFDLAMQPNRYLNRAIAFIKSKEYGKAKEALAEIRSLPLKDRFVGNPVFEESVSLLEHSPELTSEEEVRLVSELQDLNTLAHVVTRTRKRDFPGEFPVREPYVIMVKLNSAELTFYDAIYEFAKRRSRRLSEKGYELPFLTIMIRRRAASCLPAVYAHFGKILKLRKDVFREEEGDDWSLESEYPKRVIEDFMKLDEGDLKDIEELVAIGSRIGLLDSKFEKFLESVRRLFEQGVMKILVFSFFKDTLDYLRNKLTKGELDCEIAVIHGDIEVEEREKVINAFKTTTKHSILLSSEVGGEGLDLQFCNCMFNYDLPWNPMIVEQRIGRLDRLGQKERKVMIYNFSGQDTIEQTILERLYDRINIFKESLGDLEEILGEELTDLRRSVFDPELSRSQIAAELKRIADRIVAKQEAYQRFDADREKLLGQDKYFTEQISKVGTERRFITGEELENLYRHFIEMNYPASRLSKASRTPGVYLLKADGDLQEFMADFLRMQSVGKKERQLMGKLRGGGDLALTFSSDVACTNRDIEFASFCHPITKAILNKNLAFLRGITVSFLCVQSKGYTPGLYFFGVYPNFPKGF